MTSQPGQQRITTHILLNKRQPDNQIWSVNRTLQEKYFS